MLIDSKMIGEAAVEFYRDQFQEDGFNQDFSMLSYIPKLIDYTKNKVITGLPSNDEVTGVILDLNGDSACGPDGFSGLFFQEC